MNGNLEIEILSDTVVRRGPKTLIIEEDRWLELPESLHRFAPEKLTYLENEHLALRTERHQGPKHNTPEVLVQDWWEARSAFWQPSTCETKRLRQWLKITPPHGKLDVVAFRKSLRQSQLDSVPSKKQLERALNTELSITRYHGPTHGLLIPRRIRERGFITWRKASLDGIRGVDIAPHLPVENQPNDVLLCMLKWGWLHDPIKALDALHALDILTAPFPETCQVTIVPPTWLTLEVAEQIIGCSQGIVHTSSARRALYRAQKIILGGQQIQVSTIPSVPSKRDTSFFMIRQRKPNELFSRWNDGIRLDDQGRYSLTPERHALLIAQRIPSTIVYDAFAGCGGNTIAFARQGKNVLSNELNPTRNSFCRHNATVYNVEHQIQWQMHDALTHFPFAPFVFLDPPWSWGNERLQEIMNIFRQRYSSGQMKVPTNFPIPEHMHVELYCSQEFYPSFMVLEWST